MPGKFITHYSVEELVQLAENRPAILSALDGLISGLAAMRDVVDRDDRSALFDRLQHAREARANLPSRVNQPSELAEVRIPIGEIHFGRMPRS